MGEENGGREKPTCFSLEQYGIRPLQHLRCTGRVKCAAGGGEPFEQKPGDERDVSRYYDDLYFRTICAA